LIQTSDGIGSSSLKGIVPRVRQNMQVKGPAKLTLFAKILTVFHATSGKFNTRLNGGLKVFLVFGRQEWDGSYIVNVSPERWYHWYATTLATRGMDSFPLDTFPSRTLSPPFNFPCGQFPSDFE